MKSTAEEFPFDNLYDQLTNNKKRKVEDLKALLKDYNEEQCLNLLDANNWSIEASIDSLNVSKSEAVGNSTIDSSTGMFNHDHDADWRVLPRHIENEIQIPENMERIYPLPLISMEHHPWLYKLIRWTSKPFNLAFSTLNFIMRYLIFWRRNDSIPREILLSYETKLMDMLSASLLIPDSETGSVALFLGNFEEAIAQAKYEYKFLLVYLHRLGSNNSDHFLQNSLLHSEVVEVLNDPENILIWAGTLNNSEGQEVSKLLQSNSDIDRMPGYFSNPISKLFEYPEIPFLFSLLSISFTNKRLKLTVIGKLEKSVNAKELKEIILKWIEIGSRPRLKAKREKSSRDAVNNLRKMQEVAFHEMLERDQQLEAQNDFERDKEKLMLKNKEILKSKLEELHNSLHYKEGIFKSYVQLLIKMQNGRRFSYKFDVSHSIKILYYVVYCQEDTPEHFQILWNYPQKVLYCAPSSRTICEMGLEQQEDDPPSFRDQGIISDQIILVRDLDV